MVVNLITVPYRAIDVGLVSKRDKERDHCMHPLCFLFFSLRTTLKLSTSKHRNILSINHCCGVCLKKSRSISHISYWDVGIHSATIRYFLRHYLILTSKKVYGQEDVNGGLFFYTSLSLDMWTWCILD